MSVDPHPDRSDRSDRDNGELRDRQLLDDSGSVLQVRAELDALALDVLSSEGLGEPEVGKLHQFLTGDWQRGVRALRRIQEANGGLL